MIESIILQNLKGMSFLDYSQGKTYMIFLVAFKVISKLQNLFKLKLL